ncbi:hypothetical protein D6825_01525 [Candidatus Woesearchaeota archaeon]|nr:MAG: hypothetical protein D6825_01525 [Candidatus Woesearchaeota archaeon]
MKKGVLLIVLLLATSAFAFEVSVFPSERAVNVDETASFDLEIENTAPNTELFELFSSDVTWDVRTEHPLRVEPLSTLKTNLLIRPLRVNPGIYSVPVHFKRAGTNDVKKVLLQIEVHSPTLAGEYLPAVRGFVKMPEEVDPRKDVEIKVSLENQNLRNLSEVEVKLRSNLINKDYKTSLGPLEKKTLTFVVKLDKLTPPQEDVLQVSIIVPTPENAYQFDVQPAKFKVLEHGGVVPVVEEKSSFLKRSQDVVLVNEANRKLTHIYKVPAGLFKRLFISGVPDPRVEGSELLWEVDLEPGARTTLRITYNYRPLFYLAALLAIGLFVYFWFRSPLVVKKKARVLRTDEHGITDIKVVIELVNRSNKVLRKVKVLDLLPRLVDILPSESLLSPDVTKHEDKGALLKWKFEVMEPREHRILVYRARARLSVLGGLTLPVAAVHFLVDGQERESASGRVNIKV